MRCLRGWSWSGSYWVPTFGTLRRYHTSGSAWGCAQLGRSGDTIGCGLANGLHTGAGYRSGRSAIPCGGCVGWFWARSAWVADGRDASATPWSVGWVGDLHTGAVRCRSGRSATLRPARKRLAVWVAGVSVELVGEVDVGVVAAGVASPRLIISSSTVVTVAQEPRGVLELSTREHRWSLVCRGTPGTCVERAHGRVTLETDGQSHTGRDVDRCSAGRHALWF